MRMHAMCPQCDGSRLLEDIAHATGTLAPAGYLQCVCKAGHTFVLGLEEPHFVILFDLAAQAYVDGYYREAVTAMSASLERACEFFVRCVIEERGLEPGAFDDFWGTVKSRSEAQMGSFLVLYLQETGSACTLFEEEILVEGKRASLANFRNRAVHQGYLPDQADAFAYGERVHRWLFDLSVLLHTRYRGAVERIQDEILAVQFDAAGAPLCQQCMRHLLPPKLLDRGEMVAKA